MTAYSFNRRFVNPVRLGLGLEPLPEFMPPHGPKRQTIRANGKRRHARPGEELQLYHGMRTKQCFLIGPATCTRALSIFMQLEPGIISIADPDYPPIHEGDELDLFAQSDGFADWEELRAFWAETHPGVTDFRGVIIFWKPTGGASNG